MLKPYHLRRLSDVCELIARHATRQRIRPARLLGSDCTSAGAFLTIRSLLRQEGANVEGLAPSTPMAEYALRHAGVFLGPISRLAPGCLPPVTVRTTPLDALALWGMLVGLFCTLAGSFIGFYPLTLFGVLLLGLSFLLSWAAATFIPPTCVQFGELRTFRDLAVAMSRIKAA